MDINRYKPSYGVTCKHLTRMSTISTEDLFEFLYATRTIKAKYAAHENTGILNGTTVSLMFSDTSLRTRSALEIGIRQLGGTCVTLPFNEDDIGAGENIKDVVDVIARYGVGAIVTRGIGQADMDEFSLVSPIPVINSFNEQGAPLQTVCDLFTVWEKMKRLEGVKLAYIGKNTSNARSLIVGAVKCGMEVSVACPGEYSLDEASLQDAKQFGNVNITENPATAARDADIIYTDGYGYHFDPTPHELEVLKAYQVNKALLSHASLQAMVMHPLPARRDVEVTAEVIGGARSLALTQGENKLHAVKGILALLVK